MISIFSNSSLDISLALKTSIPKIVIPHTMHSQGICQVFVNVVVKIPVFKQEILKKEKPKAIVKAAREKQVLKTNRFLLWRKKHFEISLAHPSTLQREHAFNCSNGDCVQK